ncbi:hypothetical protein [Pandoraea commovens]|uniref:Uncharacterized protein n=1 Tax=Pandoraea commovens TaxID=2508289 RepID=A0ABY5QJC9_9BURK|nr:hypothetical protein [Pandoraea commovens]UVA80527.1 hypothetical protein NTU39_05765 [Pandoraea commovens]
MQPCVAAIQPEWVSAFAAVVALGIAVWTNVSQKQARKEDIERTESEIRREVERTEAIRRDEIERRDSSYVLEQAERSLARAYDALTENGSEQVAPANRLNWLMAARYIETYHRLHSEISNELDKRASLDARDFWSLRISDAISNHSTGRGWDWYAEVKGTQHRQGLEPVSLCVVYEFAQWRDDKADPIDQVDVARFFSGDTKMKIGLGNLGLRMYLAKFGGKKFAPYDNNLM